MLGGMGSSGLGNFATWVKGLLRSAYGLYPSGTGGVAIRSAGRVSGADLVLSPLLGHPSGGYIDVPGAGNTGSGFRLYGQTSATGMIVAGYGQNSNQPAPLNSSTLTLGGSGLSATINALTTNIAALSAGQWFQQRSGRSRLTADVTNATATMANLTDLSQTVIAGRKYFGFCIIYASNSVALEGLQFDFNGGTATFTSFVYGLVGTPLGATIGTAYATSAATALTATTATTGDVAYLIAFEFVCNAGGTVIPRGAEVTHTTGTATFRLGSFLLTEDSPN